MVKNMDSMVQTMVLIVKTMVLMVKNMVWMVKKHGFNHESEGGLIIVPCIQLHPVHQCWISRILQ